MLELRPNCDLVPQDPKARICSYECTFCVDCVEDVLCNVCPNCGGGFVARPIRPLMDRRVGVSRQHQLAGSVRKQAKNTKAEMI